MTDDLFAALDLQMHEQQEQMESSDTAYDAFAPLASRLRPANLDEYIGQSHLVGKGRPLYEALAHKSCYSMILWGPPGVGKTTLALIIAKATDAYLEKISAVTSGIKDIREAIDKAIKRRALGRRTVLFVDEVHRFNKSQQDAFLPHIENGTVIFIGATTENPSFEVNKALLLRARVYVLKKLQSSDLNRLIDLALTKKEGLLDKNLKLDDKVREALIELSGGDARHLLNILEMSADLAVTQDDGSHLLTVSMVGAVAGQRPVSYDKGGDSFYELISAFHKSVRGSAPDAALYWMARMFSAGCDPLYVARRLLAIATEDVGLADPKAMGIALNAYDIYKRVGDAEGLRAIAEAAVYLSLAPKSNSLYRAFNQAMEDAKNLPDYDVPMYLRNAPTALMEKLGYKEGYRYAHDYEGGYAAAECFMPEKLDGRVYYRPSDRGFEIKIAEKIAYLKGRDERESDRRYSKEHAQKAMAALKARGIDNDM